MNVITAWCEYHNGPGWSNKTFNVAVSDGNGKLSVLYFQPDETPKELHNLFSLSDDISSKTSDIARSLIVALDVKP